MNHAVSHVELARFRQMRVLVTGHTGFKGAWLCAWLQKLGARVTGISLDPDTSPSLYEQVVRGGPIEHDLRGDVRSIADVEGAFAVSDPEVVFHLAAQSLVLEGYRHPVDTFATNVMGTANVADCARRAGNLRAMVIVTSDKCYANQGWDWGYREGDALGGRDPYSASKAGAELVVQAFQSSYLEGLGIGAATVRAGNVIGGGDWARDRIVPDAVRALLRGDAIPVRNPTAIRPWQHVLEPLYGYLLLGARLAGDPLRWNGAWNFGPDPEGAVSVAELCDRMVHCWGGGSWTHTESEGAKHEAAVLRLSSDRARTRLAWRPRWNVDETVARTTTWYRRHAAGESARALCAEQIDAYHASPT